MILGMIISGFSCLLSKFLKSLGWRPKFKHHFLFRGHLTPKKSTLLISTNHHILKVKKKYQQCIQVYFSGASTWVSSNIKSRIEKVCPFSLFSLLFWWSPKREPQFGADQRPGSLLPLLSFHRMHSVATFSLLQERLNCHLPQCYKVSFSNKVKFKEWVDANKFICKNSADGTTIWQESWKRYKNDIGKVSWAEKLTT